MTGKSLTPILFSKEKAPKKVRDYVLTGRERHTQARPDNLGYPARAIRTEDYLFILNLKPDRWPAGDPAPEGATREHPLWPGYHDIDNSPTKLMLIENSATYPASFQLGYEKRQEEELYSITNDPACLKNLANDPNFKTTKNKLRAILEKDLKAQGDPRLTGNGDIFESYPRFGAMRDFPGFKEKGKYNPKFQKK
jgi:uncharacterized sulfatase